MQLVGLRFLKQQVICEWIPIQFMVYQESQSDPYLFNDSLLSKLKVDNVFKELFQIPLP